MYATSSEPQSLTPPSLVLLIRLRDLRPSQVNDAVLSKVLEWCEQHKNDPVPLTEEDTDTRKKSTDIDEWDQKFMQVDQEMLFEIILVCLNQCLEGSPLCSAGLTQTPGCELSRHQTSP